jgi:hypothetical protein
VKREKAVDPQQFAQLLEAVKNAAASPRASFDYIVVVLPVVTGIAGWVASAAWQTHQFKLNNAKEHYLLIRTKAETIVSEYTALLEFAREFQTNCANVLNLGTTITEEAINDFITRFQYKLAGIHQTQKLMFPGRILATKPIADQSDRLVETIKRMISVRQRMQVAASGPPANRDDAMRAIVEEVASVNKDNQEIMEALSKNIAVVENQIIEIINSRAKKLGIS